MDLFISVLTIILASAIIGMVAWVTCQLAIETGAWYSRRKRDRDRNRSGTELQS